MDYTLNGLGTKERIIKNSFWGLSSAVINRIGAIILTIILARMLMPEKYGVYSIVFSLAMIFLSLTDLGVNQTFIRYTSRAISDKNKNINAYYDYLLKFKLKFSFVSSISLIVLAYPISVYFFKNLDLLMPIIFSAFYIFFCSLEFFYLSIFSSIERLKYLSLTQTIRVTFLILLFYLLAAHYGVSGVFISYSIASIIVIVISSYYTHKLIPALFKKVPVRIDKKRVQKFVGYLTIASISSIFFSYVDSLILGLFVSPEYVGYYRASFSFVFSITVLLGFVSGNFVSVLSKLNKKLKEALLNISLRYAVILSIPATFGMLVLGKYFIRLLFGYDYLSAALPLYFLSFLILPTLGISIFLSLFSAEEKPQIFAKLVSIALVINILLNYLLIKTFLLISPLWATAGAAIATLISWIFYFSASLYYTKKEFKFSFPYADFLKSLAASILMSLIIYVILKIFKNIGIFSGILEVLLGIASYLLFLILFRGIRKKDLNYLLLLFKSKNKNFSV